MHVRFFEAEQWLPCAQEELFAFFSDARNLGEITPAFLKFHILTTLPIAVGEGAVIDYKLRVHGFPIRWRTEIKMWQPPNRFVDEQVRGPYRLWIHEHTLEPRDAGTLIRDRVSYALWLDFLTSRLVRRDIESIFKYPAQTLQALFGNARTPSLFTQ